MWKITKEELTCSQVGEGTTIKSCKEDQNCWVVCDYFFFPFIPLKNVSCNQTAYMGNIKHIK